MARGALSPDEALRITSSIGKALIHVHDRGLAHAALSPAGILVDGERAMLLDLGVFPTPLSSLVGPLASLPYSAPERLREGAPPSPQTDVYALASMLAEMLTGEPPADWPPDEGSFPARIAAVVDRGLDDRERRFESVDDLLIGLSEAKSIDPLPPSLPPAHQRAHPRAAYVTAARIRRPHGDALDGRIENISEGGLLVLGPSEVESGEAVLIRLALPNSGKIASEPATVCWVRAGTERAAFGVRFDSPAGQHRRGHPTLRRADGRARGSGAHVASGCEAVAKWTAARPAPYDRPRCRPPPAVNTAVTASAQSVYCAPAATIA